MLVSGVVGWGGGRTGNYIFGCICKSSMKIIIEKLTGVILILSDPVLDLV
jgi:hypothetical protein